MGNRRFAILIAIGLAIIAAGTLTILLLREDRGFPSTWPPSRVPIPVYVDIAAADYLPAVERGAVFWNGGVGCHLVAAPVIREVPIEGLRGAITFRVDNRLADDPGDRDSWPHGTYTVNAGAVVKASFVLPPLAAFRSEARAMRALAHEIGHGLGHDKDHDDDEGSVMYRRASGPSGGTGTYGVTEKDRLRLSFLCAVRRS